MKKLVSMLLATISVICVFFAFTGCEDKQAVEDNKKLVADINKLTEDNQQLREEINELGAEYQQLIEENKKLNEEYKKLEEENKNLVRENEYLIEESEKSAINKIVTVESGKLYTLRVMYDNGQLTKTDLKSIACAYYDFYKIEENPYSGMFDPHEELSEETANKIKFAYSKFLGEDFKISIDSIKITNYYGTYNGNAVVRVYSDAICIDPAYFPPKTSIGGVIFQSFWAMDILVFHI